MTVVGLLAALGPARQGLSIQPTETLREDWRSLRGRARTRDHDLGGLDDGDRVVAAPELQRPHRIGSDDGGQRLVANAEPDLGQETIDAHFVDESP